MALPDGPREKPTLNRCTFNEVIQVLCKIIKVYSYLLRNHSESDRCRPSDLTLLGTNPSLHEAWKSDQYFHAVVKDEDCDITICCAVAWRRIMPSSRSAISDLFHNTGHKNNEGPRNLLSGRGKAQLFLHSIPLPATKAMYLPTYLAEWLATTYNNSLVL